MRATHEVAGVIARISIVWAFLVPLIGARPAIGADGSDRDVVAAMAAGYTHNREKFQFLTCRWTMIIGTVASVDDAIAGRPWKSVISTSEGLWLVDGEKYRFESGCPAQEQAARPNEQGVSIPCRLAAFIHSHDGFTLSYGRIIGAGNLFPPLAQHNSYAGGPFDLGLMGEGEEHNPGALLHRALDGKYVWRFDGTSEVRGRQGLAVSLGRTPKQFVSRLVLDAERGFLPLEYSTVGENTAGRAFFAHVTDMRNVGGSRWFPHRAVVVFRPDGTPPYRTEVYHVTQLDVDNRPRANAFYLEIPKGTQINVPKEPYSMRLADDERITVADLKRLYERTKESSRIRSGSDGSGVEMINVVLAWAGVVGLILLVGILYYRWQLRIT